MTTDSSFAAAPAGARELLVEQGRAERALTAALARFQEQVQAIPTLDLATVAEAARPAFAEGIAYSAQLVDIHGRHKLRVTVMHADGAEVSSEEWADELDDLVKASGWMLAMLLGIPLANQARTAKPEPKQMAVSAQPSPAEAEDPDPLMPLGPEQIQRLHEQILALPVVIRRALTQAFREQFDVPRNARSIGDRITQHQHHCFIERFLEDVQSSEGGDGPDAISA